MGKGIITSVLLPYGDGTSSNSSNLNDARLTCLLYCETESRNVVTSLLLVHNSSDALHKVCCTCIGLLCVGLLSMGLLRAGFPFIGSLSPASTAHKLNPTQMTNSQWPQTPNLKKIRHRREIGWR